MSSAQLPIITIHVAARQFGRVLHLFEHDAGIEVLGWRQNVPGTSADLEVRIRSEYFPHEWDGAVRVSPGRRHHRILLERLDERRLAEQTNGAEARPAIEGSMTTAVSGTTKLKIEWRAIERVKPYERNPRHNDAAVDGVATSIQTFGWKQPIVVDGDGVIVVGHTRWKAAQKLGLAKVPVIVAADLTPEEVRGYRIADNKSAEASTWDMQLLPLELADLQSADFDLALLGFAGAELQALLNPGTAEGLTDVDAVPAPPDDAITQPGDIWVLGSHRLMCGDSAKPEDLDRLLAGAKIHLVNTDPPYNVNVEPRSNNARAAGSKALPAVAKNKAHVQAFDDARQQNTPQPTTSKLRAKDRVLANDFMSKEDFDKALLAWFGNMARALVPGGAFYVWGGFANWANYCQALEACGLYFSQGITWVKGHAVLGRKDFMNDCEHAWYGWRVGGGHKFYGPSNACNVWDVKKVSPQSMVHLTEKPVELAKRAIEYSSRPGENVLDLFGGSGSTLMAAETTGRRAFLMELDPLYCDVIVQRWEQFTGKKAERSPSICRQQAARVKRELAEREKAPASKPGRKKK